MDTTSKSNTSFQMFAVRLTWAIIGPLALFVMLATMTQDKSGTFNGVDIGYFAILFITIGARYWDFSAGDRNNLMGEMTTHSMLRKYSLNVLILGTGAWLLVNLIGSYL